MNQDDNYISISEAAGVAGFSRQWLKQLRKAEGAAMGETKVGAGRAFRRDAFLAWLDTYDRTRRHHTPRKRP